MPHKKDAVAPTGGAAAVGRGSGGGASRFAEGIAGVGGRLPEGGKKAGQQAGEQSSTDGSGTGEKTEANLMETREVRRQQDTQDRQKRGGQSEANGTAGETEQQVLGDLRTDQTPQPGAEGLSDREVAAARVTPWPPRRTVG